MLLVGRNIQCCLLAETRLLVKKALKLAQGMEAVAKDVRKSLNGQWYDCQKRSMR